MALPLRRRPRRSGGVRRTRPSIPCPAALENKADKSLTRLKEDRQPACVPNASRPLKARKHGPLPWYRSGRRLGNFRANRPVTPCRVRSGPGHRPLWVESPPATAELNFRSPASCQCLLLAHNCRPERPLLRMALMNSRREPSLYLRSRYILRRGYTVTVSGTALTHCSSAPRAITMPLA